MLVGATEEIFIPETSGIYLLHDGFKSYIGESKSCVRRLLTHTSGRMYTGTRFASVILAMAHGVCVGIGFLVARSWPGKPILWIGLGITELIPVGLLIMTLVLYNRVRLR